MLLLSILISVVQLVGIVGALGALAGCAKKGTKKSAQNKHSMAQQVHSSTKSAKTTSTGSAYEAAKFDPKLLIESGKASDSTNKPQKSEEMPAFTEFKPVPPLSTGDIVKRKQSLEQERERRTSKGEMTNELDDTLDAIESMRVDKSDDRTPTEHLKSAEWKSGHPEREGNLLRYEQRRRYDEWNTKPQFLHRRYMRHLTVVATMHSYQFALLQKEDDPAATDQLKASLTGWRNDLAQQFPALKHPKCAYAHGDEATSCGDEHRNTLAYVDYPRAGLDPRDDVIEMVK